LIKPKNVFLILKIIFIILKTKNKSPE